MIYLSGAIHRSDFFTTNFMIKRTILSESKQRPQMLHDKSKRSQLHKANSFYRGIFLTIPSTCHLHRKSLCSDVQGKVWNHFGIGTQPSGSKHFYHLTWAHLHSQDHLEELDNLQIKFELNDFG